MFIIMFYIDVYGQFIPMGFRVRMRNLDVYHYVLLKCSSRSMCTCVSVCLCLYVVYVHVYVYAYVSVDVCV